VIRMYNKKSQKGAALIVVLSLLSISLMVGLSSMQSSQIDERLAGNYRALSESQMFAELGASFAFDKLESDKEFFSDNASAEKCDRFLDLKLSDEERFGLDDAVEWYSMESENLPENAKVYIVGCDYGGVGAYISWGRVVSDNIVVSDRFVLFSSPDLIESDLPILLADGAISLSGSGSVASVFEDSVRIHSNHGEPSVHDSFSSQADVTYVAPGNGVQEVLVPEPRDKIFDDGTDYISNIVSFVDNNSEDVWSGVVTKACDPDAAADAATRVVLCNGSFGGNLKKNLSGKLIISTGSLQINPTDKGDMGNSSFVAAGSVSLGGMGSEGFNGVVWSAGSVTINGQGGGVVSGVIVSKSSISVNGGPDFFYNPSVVDGLNVFDGMNNLIAENPFDTSGGGGADGPNQQVWLDM